MKQVMSIYDFPDVYDVVLKASDKQIDTEVKSILNLLSKRGIKPRRILEFACGICAHGIRLARKNFSVWIITII